MVNCEAACTKFPGLCTNSCPFYTRTVHTTMALNKKKILSALDTTHERLEVFVARSDKIVVGSMMN